MSLNCPHAWEEYKKLDLAHDALRREYLALREEQSSDNSNEFKNVSKEWLVKMREFRGRCLDLRKADVVFTEYLDELCSLEEYQEIKLKDLQNKLKNRHKLSRRDLRFMYSIGFVPTRKIRNALSVVLADRDFREDLSEALMCRKDQISADQNEYLEAKDIVCHWGDFDFNKNIDVTALKLPKYVHGDFFWESLDLSGKLILPEEITGNLILLFSEVENLVLPKRIGGDLRLIGLINAKGLILPTAVASSLQLGNLLSANGLVFPKYIGHDLNLRNLIIADDVVWPEKIGGSLHLNSLENSEGLILPKELGGSLNLNSLKSIFGLDLPAYLGGFLNLSGLTNAKGLVLPTFIQGELNLNGLENADDLDLSNRFIIGQITLLSLPEDEKDKLRAKYPGFAKKIK